MRLGGRIFERTDDPETWAAAVKGWGYRAATVPTPFDADEPTVRAWREAAEANDILLAEVGAWSNPLHPDEAERQQAIDKCIAGLDLADRIGARCCVNVPGTRGASTSAFDDRNYTDETFEMIVETTRHIIDAVQPKRAKYCLEMMRCIVPDDAESYLKLLDAIDRPALAVHLDPFNIICSPRRYADRDRLLKHTVQTLGPLVVSCHLKDIALEDGQLVHLNEVRPGAGGMDIGLYLRELDGLGDADMPLILEHLPDAETYEAAAAYTRQVAAEVGVTV